MDAETLRAFLLDLCRQMDDGLASRPTRRVAVATAGLGLALAACETTELYAAPATDSEICDNLTDDDADGATDCDDPDCAADVACEVVDTAVPADTGYGAPFEDDCSDQVDNDDDGFIDCDDEDCFGDEACPDAGLYAAPRV